MAKKPTATAQAVANQTAVFDRVDACLCDWQLWAADTARGVITPAQLLAVVLYMLETDASTESDRRLIVEAWWGALARAIELQEVRPLHPITLLPARAQDTLGACVLSVFDANYFLTLTPVGFDLEKVLAYFRDSAAAESAHDATELTYAQAVAQRKDKGVKWTNAQAVAVLKEIDTRTGSKIRETIAKELGISESSLNSALAKHKRYLPAKGGPSGVVGNSNSGAAWGAAKSA